MDALTRQGRGGIWALTVAVLSLFAVVATLVIVGRETRDARMEIIRILEPARGQLYELQRLLALQEAEQRGGIAPSGLRSELPESGRLISMQDDILERLRVLAYRADPEIIAAYAELRAYARRWRGQLPQPPNTGEAGQLSPESQEEYADVLRSAARMHAVISAQMDRRNTRILLLERLEIGLIVSMVMLAFVSLMVMARVGGHQNVLVAQTRELAEEAERRRSEIERFSEEKARFIRGITHDLKNPIGAVDAYAQLLEAEIKGSLSDEQRTYVERIRTAVQQLLGTIQDMLDLSQVEAGAISLEQKETELGPLVRSIGDEYRAALEAAGLSLTIDLNAHHRPVTTDPRRIREILGNLLSNALKYTPGGGQVWLRTLDGIPRGDLGECVGIQVQDTGPGIPPEARESVFDEFQRLGREDTGGSGLGLSISRKLARLMGGDLTVDSRDGGGSSFTLWIPATPDEAGKP